MSLGMKVVTRVLLPIGFLVLGLGCVGIMALFSPTAENAPPKEEAFPVEVMTVQPALHRVQLTLTGTAEAERRVSLSPEVSGRVSYIAEGLRPGRVLGKGTRILQIDPTDFEAALASETARVKGAELDLAVEENRQKTAAREYELVGGTDPSSLALRKPHLERARANLAAAQKAEERAQRNVSRTRLKAPFNGVVVSESVDVGQWVGPGSPVIQLVGTDAARVVASIPVEQLEKVQLPTTGGERGALVTVVQRMENGATVERSGWVTGVAGQLDPQTRTASLVMSVPDPYAGGGPPLLDGSFVSVLVEGVEVEDVYEVPHGAVRQNSRIWVDENGSLQERTVRIGWRSATHSYITSGLKPGDRVITTNVPLSVKGMKVQTND